MSKRSKTKMMIFGWATVTAAALLAPSPRNWGAFGIRFSMSYDKYRHVIQPAAHFTLMAIGAFLLSRLLTKKPPVAAFLIVLVLALGFAAALELAQNILPSDFARQTDPLDLIPSLAGAVLGGLAGLGERLKNSDTA